MLGNTLRGDFGNSLRYQGQSVNEILFISLPVSASIGFAAYLVAALVGVTVGVISAVKQNTRMDYTSMGVAMIGISLPNFVLGPILVLGFALTLYWLPPARWEGFWSVHTILPVLTLSAVYMAYIARLARSGMLEVLGSNYIRTARAKGLDETSCDLSTRAPRRIAAGRILLGSGPGVLDFRHGRCRTHLRVCPGWGITSSTPTSTGMNR